MIGDVSCSPIRGFLLWRAGHVLGCNCATLSFQGPHAGSFDGSLIGGGFEAVPGTTDELSSAAVAVAWPRHGRLWYIP